MKAVMANAESVVEQDIRNEATRDEVALTYAHAIRAADAGIEVDWKRINLAILDHWSESGLQYVKAKAWKYVRGEESP